MEAKEVIDNVKKHHFWAVVVAAVGVGAYGWYAAVDDISKKTNAAKSKIESAFSGASQISSIQNHPNDAVAVGMKGVIQAKQLDVFYGWQAQFDRQKGMMRWPETFLPDFLNDVARLPYPFERIAPNDTTHQIADRQLQIYRNFIKEELPALADIVESNWSVDVSNTAGPGSPSGNDKNDYRKDKTKRQLLTWNPSNQGELVTKHFQPVTSPRSNTLHMVYAQEDYWLLKALLEIIQSVNAGAQSRFDTSIKVIESVQLGRSAIGREGLVSAPDALPQGSSNTGGGMFGGMMGDSGGMPAGGMPAGGMPGGAAMPGAGMPGGAGAIPGGGMPGGAAGAATGAAGASAAPSSADPLDLRYVDSNFNPLPSMRVRAALDSKSVADAELAIARRMPVRMRLVMDQRQIATLLAACANSPQVVEVRQLRINPQGAGAASRGRSVSERDATESDDNIVVVEVYGLIYLYNRPNYKQLDLEKDPGEKVDPTAAPANPTASATPPVKGGAG